MSPQAKGRNRQHGGQYDFENMNLICKCGHKLGVHAGEWPHDCFNYDANVGDGKDCNCKKFSPPKGGSKLK